MTHILHIDASARRTGSATRALSAAAVARLAPADATIARRDLAPGLPVIDGDWVAATFTPADARTDEQRRTLALSDQLVDELEAADIIVIGTPIYNFAVPAALKTWIDQVARVGRTFRYTDTGPEGLLAGKSAVIAIASGGTPIGSEIDFASGYLKHIFGFLGITDVTIVTEASLDTMLPGAGSRAA